MLSGSISQPRVYFTIPVTAIIVASNTRGILPEPCLPPEDPVPDWGLGRVATRCRCQARGTSTYSAGVNVLSIQRHCFYTLLFLLHILCSVFSSVLLLLCLELLLRQRSPWPLGIRAHQLATIITTAPRTPLRLLLP